MYVKEEKSEVFFSNGSKLCMYQCPVYDSSYITVIKFSTKNEFETFLEQLKLLCIFSPVAFTDKDGYYKNDTVAPVQYNILSIGFDLRINFIDGYFSIIHIPEITTPDNFDDIATLFKGLKYYDLLGNLKTVKDVYYSEFV